MHHEVRDVEGTLSDGEGVDIDEAHRRDTVRRKQELLIVQIAMQNTL
jgi:hypothetical protein